MADFTAGVGIIDMDIARDMMVFDKGRGIHCCFSSLLNSLSFHSSVPSESRAN